MLGWAKNDFDTFILMEKGDYDLEGYLYSWKEFLTKLNVLTPENRYTTSKNISLQILQGLKYLHERNFAHRDLNPKSIIIFKNKVILFVYNSIYKEGRNRTNSKNCGFFSWETTIEFKYYIHPYWYQMVSS